MSARNQPISPQSRGLWSLWDMYVLDAGGLASMMQAMSEFLLKTNRSEKELPAHLKTTVEEIAAGLEEVCEGLDLPVSVKAANEMRNCSRVNEIFALTEQLNKTLGWELDGRLFFGPLRRYLPYYEKPQLFGEEVFNAFPSANNDIFEAGTCLALERGTACVMHLMRVVEAGIKCLAKTLNVTDQNDWGAYFREIDKELDARIKAAGKRTPDEQFFAEVRVTLDGVRMAWRNRTMHIENNYSPERAEDILIAVRSLMRHLSSRLSEPA